jgi:hypothetical protein
MTGNVSLSQGELEHQEYIKKRSKFWVTLKQIRKEYQQEVDSQFEAYDFALYVQEKYGIKLNIVDNNFLGGNYTIVDEKKYTYYTLKFE